MKEVQFTHNELVVLWEVMDRELLDAKMFKEAYKVELQSSFDKLDAYIRDHADEDTLEFIPSYNG